MDLILSWVEVVLVLEEASDCLGSSFFHFVYLMKSSYFSSYSLFPFADCSYGFPSAIFVVQWMLAAVGTRNSRNVKSSLCSSCKRLSRRSWLMDLDPGQRRKARMKRDFSLV